MKKQLKHFLFPLRGLGGLYIAAVLCMSASCIKEDRTTVVFGTVKDDVGRPIEGIEMVLYGEKGVLGSRATLLKTIRTDATGNYNITADIPKDYHSGNILCNFFNDPKIGQIYDSTKGDIFFNKSLSQECCRASVGQKSQYDFILVRK